MTGATGGDSRPTEIDRKKGKEFKTKGHLLHVHAIDGAGRGGGTTDLSSSDADGGIGGEESSDDDDESRQSKGIGKHRNQSPAPSRDLPSSLMSALTMPPPSPLSMASEEFIRDFLSKYPPAPKSYEVVTVDCLNTLLSLNRPPPPRSLQLAAKYAASASRSVSVA